MSIAGDPLDDMLGDEAVPARVATPQVADDIVRQVCGCLRCDHRVGANRACRKIASMRRGVEQGGRPDFSKRWHRDLLLRLIGLDFQVRYTHGLTMSQYKCVSFTNSSSAKLGFRRDFLAQRFPPPGAWPTRWSPSPLHGNGEGLYLYVLTRFLDANRIPLRSKTLCG